MSTHKSTFDWFSLMHSWIWFRSQFIVYLCVCVFVISSMQSTKIRFVSFTDLMSMTQHLISTNSLIFRLFFNFSQMRIVAFLLGRRLHVYAKNISSLCKHVLPCTHTSASVHSKLSSKRMAKQAVCIFGNSCHVCASNNFGSVHKPHHFGFPIVRSNAYIYSQHTQKYI